MSLVIPSCLQTDYLSEPKQWRALAKVIRNEKVCGLDTEFYNVNLKKQSCYTNAKIHVWSLAVRTGRLAAMGYTRCKGWCLPEAALESPELREVLEDVHIRKEIHNQSVDVHSLANYGIIVRGGRNTLGLVKWCRPDLFNQPGRFKLKALMQTLLYRAPVTTFKKLLEGERTVIVSKTKTVKALGCSCGVPKCRKRKGHTKTSFETEVTTHKEKLEKFTWELQDILPGTPRFSLLVEYSIEDAIAALQVAEIADEAQDPAPFPYANGPRPVFCQELEEAFITMEQSGFARDEAFCDQQIAVAEQDEAKELAWLFRWFLHNGSEALEQPGPWHPTRGFRNKSGKESGVNGLWSSPVRLAALFDAMGFPRSPVWSKGRVKQGEIKLDAEALKWIKDVHPPAEQVIEHLLALKNIRANSKYFYNLKEAGDMVFIMCGGSDDDETAGAVTGRAAVKGALAAQQLPSNEDKDLYHVRKAIIA